MMWGRDWQLDEARKGPWMPEEDIQLARSVTMFGERRWDYIARVSGLKRSGKSCRMRWMNYLRPDLKHGRLTSQEEDTILQLHACWGNKWARIARKLPGRTDNEIKNYWRSHLRRKTPEDKVQRKLEAASGPSDLTVGKENIQGAQISSFDDQRSIGDGKQQASEDSHNTLDASLPLDLQIDDDPFAMSPYEARLSEWVSGLMNGYDTIDHHHGFNGLDSTKLGHPTWISLNGDIMWEYHFGCLWNIDDDALSYKQCGGHINGIRL